MFRSFRSSAVVALLVATGGCADFLSTGSPEPSLSQGLTAAFSTVPAEFTNAASSYGGDPDGMSSLWLPGPRGPAFGREGLMGGGLGDAFAGGMPPSFAHAGGGRRGPFGGRFGGARTCDGAFNAGTGWFVCTPVTRNGVTINQQIQYKNTAGTVQSAYDSATTNAVQVQSNVAGTVSFVRDSTRGGWGGRKGPPHMGHLIGDSTTVLTANTTLSHASDRTVTGLAAGSTKRTVNGTSRGEESTTGTSSKGNFTARRAAADTTRGLVIPIVDGGKTYPTAGTVIRVMTASVTFANAAPVTASRREVITYDGTDVAKIVVTINGDTKNCTMQLPRGRLNCS
ncbi:MAG TPA: hypothetical protein VFV33_21315 [Gemmatimonadaceae bacterium]|nr:hypothetical protein [Gemmatimonadaceae bacterium]